MTNENEPYVNNLEQETANNNNFRKVLNTTAHSQLVVMSLKAGEEIGLEVHPKVDQFLRIESGEGKAILNGKEYILSDGFAVVVPAGTNHNIINTGSGELKLYTIYSPANHPVGTIHATKTDADAAETAEHH